MQSYNFHAMRHLCDQVQRAGPLWNCSAFAFESANHFLLRALSGTIKRPERITDQFLKNKWQLTDEKLQMGRDSLQEFNEHHYTALTVMSVECELFCGSFEDISVALGRYKNESGTIFYSMSYPRLKGNLANCVVWKSQLNFYQVEVLLSATDKTWAICREFIKVEPLERLPSSNSFNVNQLFCIGQLGDFTVADTSCLVGKLCAFVEGRNFSSEPCERRFRAQLETNKEVNYELLRILIY